MATFNLDSKKSNQYYISFAHPSIDALKDKPLVITPIPACRIDDTDGCDSSGILNYSKNIFAQTIPKSSSAPNSARLSKDLKIGKIEVINLEKIPDTDTFVSFRAASIPFPEFDQQGSENCQLLASLTAVQKSVNFPIDWGQFLKCLPNRWSNHDIATDKKLYSSQKEFFKNYFDTLNNEESSAFRPHLKLFNALFSDECLPISPAMPGITNCSNGKIPISKYHGTGGGDDGCKESCNPETVGIRIVPNILSPDINIDSAGALHALRRAYGPRPIAIQGNDYIKMEIVNSSKSQDGGALWDSLSLLNHQELKDRLIESIVRNGTSPEDAEIRSYQIAGSAHAITLINSNGPDDNGAYKLTLRNSWKDTKDIEITWKNASDLSIDKTIMPDWAEKMMPKEWKDRISETSRQARKYLYNNIVYKVQPCDPNIKIIPRQDCKKQNCKDLGYDSDNPQASDSECPCKCIEGTNNINRLIQREYCTSCTKCECPKDPLIICGPDYNSDTQKVDKCDCECIDSKKTYPCSGGNAQSFKSIESLRSVYNIVTIEDIKITE